MKFIGLSCVLAGLALAGCNRQATSGNDPRTVEATPIPTPEYAKPGIFYLVASVRKETKDGISRLTPGTEVRLVRPGIYKTPLGEMPLNSRDLTNDLTIARAVVQSDRTGQSAALPKAASPVVAAPRPVAQMAVAGTTAPLSAAAQEATRVKENLRTMSFQLSALKNEETSLQSRIEYLQRTVERNRGRSTTSTAASDLDACTQKLASLQQSIQVLQARMEQEAK